MSEIGYNSAFLRNVKHLKRKHCDMAKLIEAEKALRQNDRKVLASKYKDHQLVGNLAAFSELYLGPDWRLVYRVEGDMVILRPYRQSLWHPVMRFRRASSTRNRYMLIRFRTIFRAYQIRGFKWTQKALAGPIRSE